MLRLFNPVTKSKKKRRGKTTGEEEKTSSKENNDHLLTERPGAEPECSGEGTSPMFVRKPGESKKDFFERIDIETKIKVADCMRKEKKSDRRIK